MKKINLDKSVKEKQECSYTYKIDCNNDWGIVWVNPENKTCYLGMDADRCYAFPEEAYTYVFEDLLNL